MKSLILQNKFGGNTPNHKQISDFNKLFNHCNLIDLGFTGPKFTWTNHRSNSQLIMERLIDSQQILFGSLYFQIP